MCFPAEPSTRFWPCLCFLCPVPLHQEPQWHVCFLHCLEKALVSLVGVFGWQSVDFGELWGAGLAFPQDCSSVESHRQWELWLVSGSGAGSGLPKIQVSCAHG